jgi:polyphosphate glucokinase
MQVLGVDIGGSSIKAAPVDVRTGKLTAERLRLETPQQLPPEAMAARLATVVGHFSWHGPVGIGFPAALRNGVALTAANIAPDWLHLDVAALLTKVCPGPVTVVNDADAAGLAELKFGAGVGEEGVVILVTVGTGLGTALFVDGHLLPNTELGHLYLGNVEAEWFASDAARIREGLDWPEWSLRLADFLCHLEKLFWPDLLIIGGGTSYYYEKFFPLAGLATRVVPAQLFNDAGIVGAASAAVRV